VRDLDFLRLLRLFAANPIRTMTDIFTQAQRSALMAKVLSKGNASTELKLVAAFRTLGITGWRRGVTLSPVAVRPVTKALRASATSGKSTRPFRVRPDFVFPKLRIAVFVDGCFWHGCPIHATQPKQNAEFWRTKIAANQARDWIVTRQLRARGWRVLRLWEHELTKRYEVRLLARLRRIGLLAVFMEGRA
jgi:DNA mismatch endonuclease, patch repair protein